MITNLNKLLNQRKIDSNDCWIFIGYKNPSGYGTIRYKNKTVLVHRLIMHFLHNFDLNSKNDILHKPLICKSKSCFNDTHLYVGDHYDNMQDRIITKTTNNQNKNATNCQNNHLFDEINTGTYKGKRYCKACKVAYQNNRRATKREANVSH